MKSKARNAAIVLTTKRAGKLTGKALKQGVKAINPIECLREIVSARAEYLKISEQEQTKRRKIEEEERVQLSKIEAQTQLMMEYLTLSFDERRDNFAQLFSALDKASEAGDTVTAARVLDAIVQLGKSGPFEALSAIQGVRDTLKDRDKQFEF